MLSAHEAEDDSSSDTAGLTLDMIRMHAIQSLGRSAIGEEWGNPNPYKCL